MHVRIAWEIYLHTQPEKAGNGPGGGSAGQNPSNPATSSAPGALSGLVKPPSTDLRTPGHMFTSSAMAAASSLGRPHEHPSAYPPGLARNPYDAAALAASAGFLGGPPGHMGKFFDPGILFSVTYCVYFSF